MKRFAAFDIDGTLVRWQLYHAIASELAGQGLFTPEQLATIEDARTKWKNRTHEDSFKTYEQELVNAYSKAMLNLDVDRFNHAAEAVFNEYKDQIYIYTKGLIKQLKEEGYLLFAISGSQTEVVEKIAHYYGFDDYLGTLFEQKDGHFTGAAKIARSAKDKALQRLAAKHNASYEGSIAVGDSLSDVPMLAAVERPIAFNPEKRLFAHARDHGWDIVVERKNTVYELRDDDGIYVLA
jgi:HAD superfamily hydrolase (TIGR01490 family)